MRVFVSSLIGGFEPERAAAKRALTTLRHAPVMAEDFAARPNSPQVACLQELRSSDAVILILGERYGEPQKSGLSPTHEEYREARDSKPILAFVQEDIQPEPAQRAFIHEVQEWEGGLYRQGFRNIEDLQTQITRALHDLELTQAQAPVDADELQTIAAERLPTESRGRFSSSNAQLCISLIGGPRQKLLRASTIEDEEFADRLQQSAQFGANRLFESGSGTSRSVENDALVLRQENGASITITENADVLLEIPLGRSGSSSRYELAHGSVIFEEDVTSAIRKGLEFAADLLEGSDPTQRLSQVGIAVTILGAEYRAWRTRSEHQKSPNSIEICSPSSREHYCASHSTT